MTVSFVGFGNMGQQIARGLIASGAVSARDVAFWEPNAAKGRQKAEQWGATYAASNADAASRGDFCFLCVKPHLIEGACGEIGPALKKNAIVVSVAAGVSLAMLRSWLPEGTRCAQCMPNLPIGVRKGAVCLELSPQSDEETLARVENLLAGCASTLRLPHELMAAAGAIAGCGPAFVSVLIEAMADAGVKHGLKRADAYALSRSVFEGAARLMAETGKIPAAIKDEVCSPGGTTIRGVMAMESAGARAAIQAAVEASLGAKP